jgi:hypothetical protein
MTKLTKILATAFAAAALFGSNSRPAHGTAAPHLEVRSVPEAWSPEGRAPHSGPSVPEAWSPEGRAAAAATLAP